MILVSATVFYAVLVLFGQIEFTQTWFVIALGVDIMYEVFMFTFASKEKDFVPIPKALVFYVILAIFGNAPFSVLWLGIALLVDSSRYLWGALISALR